MVRAKKLLNIVVVMILALTLKTNADEVCLRAAMVSGGEFHTLVLMENGTVWACGSNGNGRPAKKSTFFILTPQPNCVTMPLS